MQVLFSNREKDKKRGTHRFPVNLFAEYEEMSARESDATAFLLNTAGDLRRALRSDAILDYRDVITR